MKTVALIQARTSSRRLPGKVLLPLKGKPLLERMLQRVAASSTISEIVVTTTCTPEDELIRDICKRVGIRCFSGHTTDLLDRNYKAAINCNADMVVKIPSNCPLIDHTIIDKVLGYYFQNLDSFDYLSNLHPATYPAGNDIEAIPIDILRIAWTEAAQDFEREHTTPFIWDQPNRFQMGNYEWGTGLNFSMTHRWSIDYMEDYIFIRSIFEELFSEARLFLMTDILQLLDERPELKNLNAKYVRANENQNQHTNQETVALGKT